MRITVYNEQGDRRDIPAIDYTQAVRNNGWYADGDRPQPQLQSKDNVHPALALLNTATEPEQLIVLPSVGRSRAKDILELRIRPWDSLESAQADLGDIPIDWGAILVWQP